MTASTSAEVRAALGHPVIDCDGHIIEPAPLVAEFLRDLVPGAVVDRFLTERRVHFAVRSATDENLIDFLRSHAPAVADEHYGQGHEQATGGTLSPAAWNEFVTGLGFGSEMHWSAEPQEL